MPKSRKSIRLAELRKKSDEELFTKAELEEMREEELLQYEEDLETELEGMSDHELASNAFVCDEDAYEDVAFPLSQWTRDRMVNTILLDLLERFDNMSNEELFGEEKWKAIRERRIKRLAAA